MRSLLRSLGVAALLHAGAASAQQTASPWDIYLACRGTGGLDSLPRTDPSRPALERVDEFCSRGLPLISRNYTQTELRDWERALQSRPGVEDVRIARELGEAWLMKRAREIGSTRLGTGSFTFLEDAARLEESEETRLAAIAEQIAAQFHRDSAVVNVYGSADYQSNDGRAYNRDLAQRRADYIAHFLLRAGVPDSMIKRNVTIIRTRGSEAPATDARVAGFSTPIRAPGQSVPSERRASFGLTPTEIAIGTTDFLLTRARGELERYVLRVGINRMCAARSWQEVLTSTCALLPVDSDTIRYNPGPGVLRDALRSDLRNLPAVVAEKRLGDLATSNPDRPAAMAIGALRYLRQVGSGVAPLEALGKLDTAGMKAPSRLLELASLASRVHSARTELADQLGSAELSDTVALYAVRSLLLDADSVGNTASLSRLVQGARTAHRVALEVDAGWKAVRAAHDSSATSRRLLAISDLLTTASELLAIELNPEDAVAIPRLRREVLQPARDLVSALALEDRATAASSVIRLVRMGAENGDIRLSAEQTRLLAFATDASTATTTEEFSSALERLVGAESGYLSKRESIGRRYVRLNAFVGGNGALEYVGHEGISDHFAPTLSLTVPIGVEIGSSGPRRRSNGVFFQVLDLGAVASARIGGSDVENLPDFKLGTVVAPGLFWMHGYKDAPVASGFGVAYFPEGRVTPEGKRIGALRLTVMVGVDLPLFP
jgi:outer membrane protein OmpA-like peptidoglycan-associated protein